MGNKKKSIKRKRLKKKLEILNIKRRKEEEANRPPLLKEVEACDKVANYLQRIKYNKKKPNAKLTHSLDTLTMFSEVGMTPPRTGKQVEGLKAVIAEKKEKVLVEQAEIMKKRAEEAENKAVEADKEAENVKEAAEHAEQMIAEAKEEIASEEKGTEEPKAEEQAPAEESKEKSDEPKEETKTEETAEEPKTEEPASEEPAAEESKTEETTPATDA